MTDKQPEAFRLADALEQGTYLLSAERDVTAAELRRLVSVNELLLDALKISEQFMNIASDWNIDEAEINGEMRSTYDLLDLVQAAIAKAEAK